MKELQRNAVLLKLVHALDERGSWCGETHIQKATFVLEEATHVPLDLSFMLYKHGPFSFELREVLSSLMCEGFVELYLRDPSYGPSFRTTATGDALSADFPRTLSKYRPQIDYVAERLCQKGVDDLEKVATALFVLREDPVEPDDARASIIHDLKPHIPVEEAKEALIEAKDIMARAPELQFA